MRFLAAVLLVAAPVFAQIEADRPGFADGPATVGARTAQIEIGVSAEESIVLLPTLLRYGLSDALELRVESDVVSDEGDIAPFAAGFKWRLRENIAVLGSIQPPSGGGSLRADGFESEVRLVGSVDVGGFSVIPNVGVALAEGDGAVAVIAGSLEKELGDFVPFVDFEGRDSSAIVDGGVAWIVRDDTQLDLSGGVSVAGDEHPDWFVSAGFSRRF
jgi:Putative MetA-pathway of phenol degradation